MKLTQNNITALCGNYKREPLLEDEEGKLTIPNPETETAFAERMVSEFVKNHTEVYFGDKMREEYEPTIKTAVEEKVAISGTSKSN